MDRRSAVILVIAIFLAVLSTVLGVAIGSADVSIGDVIRTTYGSLQGTAADDATSRIILQLRFPRVVLGFVVGGGLAIVGVAMQALVRNPLAEPYILGISGGASAGASFFYLGFLPAAIAQTLSMPLAAFAGALLTITLVYLVARSPTHISVARLLLAGVAMSALAGAVTAFVTFASPEPDRVRAVMFWLMGSFSGSRWAAIPIPLAVSGGGLIVLLAMSRALDAFLLGEDRAWNLGVPVETVKRVLLVLAALITGPLVAAVGAIGFVGLIVPHVARMLVGVSHTALLLVAYFLGGTFMIWADAAARVLIPAQELPVGVLTALCGVPFFLWLLRRKSYQFG